MRAAEAEPGQFLPLKGMARAYVNLGDHEAAKLCVEQALAIAPTPIPKWDERFFAFLARATVTAIRLWPPYRKRIAPAVVLDLDLTRSAREWTEWAHEYLAWHASAFPSSGPSAD